MTGIYFIKSHIFPESKKPIGKNIEIVVKFHEIIGFQYELIENHTASHFFNHFFNHSSNHSITTIKLSTIIQRVSIREKLTILLNVYPILFNITNVIKYTRGKTIEIAKLSLNHINNKNYYKYNYTCLPKI